MKRMISLLLAGLMLLTAVPSVGLAEQGTTGHSNPLAVSDSTNGSVIDGVKDSFYTEERSIGSDYWSFYSGNVTTADPVDTERLLNKLYFNWDEDFVYLYFESTYTLEDEHLYKPAEGEERDSQGERYPWYEQISLYLDTAPSLSYEAPCQAPSDWNDPYCSHFHCNANDGEGKHYRLQARTAPAFGDWWNYYRSDEGMFMTYEEFVDYRTTPESRGYDEQYVDDPMGWYLKNNGAGEAASFVNYETDTYGFELKYPRREGEEYFQVNVVNDVNAYEWAEYGPELPYTLSFCEAWWMSAEGMVKIWYEDFQGNDSVADSVASVESMITVLPDSVTLDDEEKVIAAFEAYMALTESQKSQVSQQLITKLETLKNKIEQLKTQSSKQFVVDGELDPWYLTYENTPDGDWNTYHMKYFDAYVRSGAGNGSAPYEDPETKAVAYTAYDDDYIYFYIKVWDDELVFWNQLQPNDYDVGSSDVGDSIEIWFDPDPNSALDGDYFCTSTRDEGQGDVQMRLQAALDENGNFFINDFHNKVKPGYNGVVFGDYIYDTANVCPFYFENDPAIVNEWTGQEVSSGYGVEVRLPRNDDDANAYRFNIAVNNSSENSYERYALALGGAWWLSYAGCMTVKYQEENPFFAQEILEEEPSVANGFEYTVENNQVTITRYVGNETVVDIPSVIEGVPVTAIGNRAFYDCESIIGITLPDSLIAIDEYAFCGCDSLKEITIPESVRSIGQNAFFHCDDLTAITVAANNLYYCDLNGVLLNKGKTTLIQYPMGKSGTSYAVPGGVTTLAEAAFYGCSHLTKITLPSSVTTIGGQAFYDCENITEMVLPAGLTALEENVFFNCTGLTAITLPGGVKTLKFGTFGGCTALTQVELGDGITAVEDYAFFSCTALVRVNVPMSVTAIAASAFTDCADGLTLYGYTDSYAQAYAQSNGISFGALLDENAPAFMIENVTAKLGETFTIAVKMQNNPGIVSYKVKVGYDTDVLEAVSVKVGDFAGTSFSPVTNNPIIVNWVDSLYDNNTNNGVMAYITFKVKESAIPCTTPLTLTYDPNDVFDFDYNNVVFYPVSGQVRVIDYISGDVNQDDNVDNKDLSLLLRYLNEWQVTVKEEAADVNRDGLVNNKDYSILERYLNGWDVELK